MSGLKRAAEAAQLANVIISEQPETLRSPPLIDLNKIYEPMREGMSLTQLAVEIRGLIEAEDNTRLALSLRLLEAKRLVDARKGTNMSWEEWCAANVRKRNNEPFAPLTIETYLKIARSSDPALKLEQVRASSRSFAGRRLIFRVGNAGCLAKIAPTQAKINEVLKMRDAGLSHRQIAAELKMNKSSVGEILRGTTKSAEFYLAQARERESKSRVEQVLEAYGRCSPEERRQVQHALNLRPLP